MFADAWGCFLQLRERLLAEVRPPRVRYSTIGETSVVLETPGEFQAELTLSVGTPKVPSQHIRLLLRMIVRCLTRPPGFRHTWEAARPHHGQHCSLMTKPTALLGGDAGVACVGREIFGGGRRWCAAVARAICGARRAAGACAGV